MKAFLVLFLTLVLVSCGYKTREKKVLWREGDSLKELQSAKTELQNYDWKTLSAVNFAGFKIESRSQVIQGKDVHQTMTKQVIDLQSNGTEMLFAQYQKKGLLPAPSEDKTEASEALQEFLKKNPEYSVEKIEIPKPVYAQTGGRLRFLWRGIFENSSGGWEILFDKNGSLDSVTRISTEFDAEATVFPKGPKRSDLTQVLLKELSEFQRLSSDRVLVMSEAPDSALNIREPLNFNPQDLKFDQVQAYFHLDSSLRWFEENFGYKPNRKIEAVVHMSYPDKTNAAFYYGGRIRIGSGDGISYSHIAQDPSIVIHESAHSVIEAVAHLPYEGEGGSLNEGFADFFAAAQLKNPYMGEVAFMKGPYKRTLMSVVKLDEKNGGLYHDSQILSGLLWEFHQTLGDKKSLKIASRLLVEMHPASDFAELKTILPKALQDVLEPGDLRKSQKILMSRGF